MKKFWLIILLFNALLSCSSKDKNPHGELSKSDIANLQETSEINIENIDYKGTFRGNINGNEVELKLNGDSFEWLQNGKRIHGNWSKVNDATTIYLEPKNGKLNVKYLNYADENSWLVLTDSLTFPTEQQFLKRIPD